MEWKWFILSTLENHVMLRSSANQTSSSMYENEWHIIDGSNSGYFIIIKVKPYIICVPKKIQVLPQRIGKKR